MPRMGSFGSASWNAFRSKGVLPAVNVLAATYQPNSSGSQLFTFPGCTAGQLAVIIWTRANPSGLAGWTHLTTFAWTVNSDVFYKVLSAGDVSTGVTFSYGAGNGVAVLLVYDVGPTTVTSVSQATGGGGTLAMGAVTENQKSRRLIAYGATSASSTSVTKPAGWTNLATCFFNGANPNASMAVADIKPSDYPNASTPSWTGSPQAIECLELT